jgi:hypothetical protein
MAKKSTKTMRAGVRKLTRRDSPTAAKATATARRQSVFPAHLSSSPEEWRRIKRTEWMEVMQALDRYRFGAAYTPANAALWHLGRLAQQVEDALDRDWVAW